ncbi:MAG: hypothetical protein AB1405_11290 [Bdellovibrionota bacterium]
MDFLLFCIVSILTALALGALSYAISAMVGVRPTGQPYSPFNWRQDLPAALIALVVSALIEMGGRTAKIPFIESKSGKLAFAAIFFGYITRKYGKRNGEKSDTPVPEETKTKEENET